MTGMLGSPKVRTNAGVDNPWFDDGFYNYWKPRGNAGAGNSTTGKRRRRAVRKHEKAQVRREIQTVLND